MTKKLIELGRRAVACADWKWMPGMLAVAADTAGQSDRVVSVAAHGRVRCHGGGGGYEFGGTMAQDDSVPDFSDPATIGCMMYLVRAALNDPSICWVPGENGGWCIASRAFRYQPGERLSAIRLGDTLADALVVALESFERAEE
jgi:hypothetical protein